jgi:hypothetical protein
MNINLEKMAIIHFSIQTNKFQTNIWGKTEYEGKKESKGRG